MINQKGLNKSPLLLTKIMGGDNNNRNNVKNQLKTNSTKSLLNEKKFKK